MSSVTNVVLQVEGGNEGIVENINLLLKSYGIEPLHKVGNKVPGNRKLLEVDVYLLTLNGEDELAEQIINCVRNYQEDIPEVSQTVLILTRHDQTSQVICPNSDAELS